MRGYWILPNRDQGDEILASDGQTIIPLREILDPKDWPDGFSHGVPTELLETCGPEAFAKILFAQRFPKWEGTTQLLSVSSIAGVDGTGRVVHLGALFMLEPNELPRFEVPYAVLSKDDRAPAKALNLRMTSPEPDDSWAQSVWEVSKLAPDRRPVTNVALQRSVVRFYSLYVATPNGLMRNPLRNRRRWTRTSMVLILVAVVTTCGILFAR